MSCVRKILVACALALVAPGGACAAAVPFFFSPSTLVYGDPGFGAALRIAGDGVDETHYHAWGVWEYGRYRGAFAYEFAELDSIYRLSRWSLPAALLWTNFGVRGGYGVSVEWIPSDAFWTRHRYEAGLLARYGSAALDLGVEGFADSPPKFIGSLFWAPSEGFRVFGFVESSSATVGYSLAFSHLRVDFSGRFPGFAVSLGLNFGCKGWNVGGNRQFGGDDMDWNTFWITRSLKK